MKDNNRLVYPKDLLNKGRSTWKMPCRVKSTFMHGDAVPMQWMEVLPGDEISCPIAELIRMSTPIAPIMDDITFHVAAYFVPMRIVFENWEELCGANKDGAWTTGQTDVTVPHLGEAADDTSHYLGGPAQDSNFASNHGNITNFKYFTLADFIGGTHEYGYGQSLLPYRAYYEIINNNYRSQVVSAPIPIDKSSNNAIIVGEDPFYTVMRKCEPLGKYPDLFTKCLPEPQKGDAVKFLKDLIPVGVIAKSGDMVGSGNGFGFDNSNLSEGFNQSSFDNIGNSDDGYNPVHIWADMSQSLTTINDLRYAFQLQKFLEADARFGTRYFEYLNAHFGITIAEGVAQLPVWLGEDNFRINIDQVLSTAGYAAGSSTSVGAPGANSVTGKKDNLFNFTAKEHGYIIWIVGCRHNQTYSFALRKDLFHLKKLDFYHPEFANIGEVAVSNREIFAYHTYPKAAFGYQEAWYEYRFIPDRCLSLLCPDNPGSLSFWTLSTAFRTNNYDPQLNEEFIYESRENISRVLTTGENGPDYIGDFFFDLKVTRIMPAYSIPGFADHH